MGWLKSFSLGLCHLSEAQKRAVGGGGNTSIAYSLEKTEIGWPLAWSQLGCSDGMTKPHSHGWLEGPAAENEKNKTQKRAGWRNKGENSDVEPQLLADGAGIRKMKIHAVNLLFASVNFLSQGRTFPLALAMPSACS